MTVPREEAALKSWHDKTCPAVLAYVPETECECGGALRHYDTEREKRRKRRKP